MTDTSPGIGRVPVEEEFLAEGVRLVLLYWPVLRVAVEEQWGGDESEEKLEWLTQELVRILSPHASHRYSSYDVELILDDVLSAEFNVDVEDDSIGHVAHFLVKMSENCLRNDYSDVVELKERFSNMKQPPIYEMSQLAVEQDASVTETVAEEPCVSRTARVPRSDTILTEDDPSSDDRDQMETEDGWRVVGSSRHPPSSRK